MKVLVVEDNAHMRRFIRSVLAGLAEDVFECSHGSQALAAYVEYMPDWVLMDMDMPDLDGINATRLILAAFPRARVVIVTHYDDARTRAAAIDAGACAFLGKENLLEVRRLLRCA